MGDGAAIAATTRLPVINDLRSLDVAFGGQGAPIVPIGDKLLFGEFDYVLNIGGIANMTVRKPDGYIAFDICPANQILNALAAHEGKEMDVGGQMAASGLLLQDVLGALNDNAYYSLLPPKSLSNDAAKGMIFPILFESNHNNMNLLHTVVVHIAEQIAHAVRQNPCGKEASSLLITGGGAFNTFLTDMIQKDLKPYNVVVTIPENDVVKYKEALVMALIGTLRWREETNVLSSVTGAATDSCGGALWVA